MGLKEFQDLLDRYGGDPKAWPDEYRDEALALVGTSADAAGLHDEMRRIERLLGDVPAAVPNAGAINRVMEKIRDHESRTAAAASTPRLPLGKEIAAVLGELLYRPAVVFATVSLIGILVGVVDRATSANDVQAGFFYLMMTL